MKMEESRQVSILKTIKERGPWKEFICGLFIPLNLMLVFKLFKMPLVGVMMAIAWSVFLVVYIYFTQKRLSVMALIGGGMILIHLGTGIYFHRNHVLLLVSEALDNSLLGFVFLGSLFFSMPFILLFIEKETLNSIPEKIRNSPHFLPPWKTVTATWGIFYILTAGIILYMKLKIPNSEKAVEILDYLFGWPAAGALLGLSVAYPVIYWRQKMSRSKTQKEGKGAGEN